MGGTGSEFPETAWSSILTNPASRREARAERLNELFCVYWRPMYNYLRAKWRKSNEDAKDLIQGFYLHVLDSDFFEHYRRESGRFRTFVKASLDHFVTNAHRDEGRLKRGGGSRTLSIDLDEGLAAGVAADGEPDPETAFDRQWARTLTETAVSRVEREMISAGKQASLDLFRAFEFPEAGSERPSYKALAKEFGITEVDVSNRLQAVRGAIRRAVTDLVRETVADNEAFREEMALLTGERP